MPHQYTRVSIICTQCGKGLLIKPSRVGRTQYCSRACRALGIRTHGDTINARSTVEYKAWRAIKNRCLNPLVDAYPDYGGRGITVCAAWKDSFETFLADMGRRPSPNHSIDRIDVNGNYEPDNVRWATWTEQQRNRRSNRLVTYCGVTQCVSAWSDATGIHKHTLRTRLDAGWSVERTLTTPAAKRRT